MLYFNARNTEESRLIASASNFKNYDPDLRETVIDRVKYTLSSYGDWNYTDSGVKAIVDTWFVRKQNLLSVLANHPNYDREHFCVRLDNTQYKREIDSGMIDRFMYWLPTVNEILKVTNYSKSKAEVIQLRKAFEFLLAETKQYIGGKGTETFEGEKTIYNYYNIPYLNAKTMKIEWKPVAVYQLKEYLLPNIDTRYQYLDLDSFCNDYPYQATYNVLVDRKIKEVKEDIKREQEGKQVSFRYLSPEYITESEIMFEAKTRVETSTLEEILRKYNIRLSKGQKRTKVILKVARELGLTNFPDFNKEYSKYCDAINPLDITMDSVVSANIIDYLLQSNGDSWSSCHNIAKYSNRGEAYGGCNCAGAMSYALDSVSLIYYTNTKESLEEYCGTEGRDYVEKHTRAMIYTGHDMEYFVMSCVYPSRDENLREQALPIVEKILADSLGTPNFWKSHEYNRGRNDYVVCYAGEGNCAYQDWQYDYFHGKVVWLNGKDTKEMRDIEVGAPKICPVCGTEDMGYSAETGTLYCEYCVHEGEIKCERCGEYVNEDYICYSEYDGCYYCEDCCIYSDYMNDYINYDNAIYISRLDTYVHEDLCVRCDFCGQYEVADDMISSNGCDYCAECVYNGDVLECSVCGDWIPAEEACWDEETESIYCSDCYDELLARREEENNESVEVA